MANLRTNNLSGEQGQNAYRGSLFFDGVVDKLSVPNSADVRLGSNDFTVEAWVKFGNPEGSWDAIIGMWDHTQTRRTFNLQRYNTNGQLYLYVSTDGGNSNWAYANGGNLTVNHWHHVAGVRDGNTLRVYQNGVQVGTASYSDTILNNTTDALFIGDVQTSDTNNMNGFISNVRLINGTCIYPNGTTFTPPQHELTLVPNTVVLACQDSDNPLQEATGKTFTGFGRYEHLNDTELVTNGSGLTTTGWTNANTSTFTVENGMIKVTRSGGTGPTAYQTITTVTGQQYTVSANIQYVSGNYADLRVYNGSDSSGTLLKFLRSTGTSTDGNISSTFTAESTSTTLFFVFDDGGNTGKFSQISVKAADRGKQPEVIPPYGVDAGNTFGGPIQQSSQGYMYFPTGRTEERGGGIGIVAGGYSAATNPIDTIESIRIQTMGNSIEFGTLNAGRFASGAVASTSRVIFGGGYTPSNLNSMEFVNPITQGNGTDAGDLSAARKMPAGLGNSTRGIFAGGLEPSIVNTIEFVTIASLGDAVNFGDLTSNTQYGKGCASPTRGIINCAAAPSSRSNVINFITIASAGDAQDFGDMTEAFGMTGFGLSDATRGVIGGHYISPANNHSNVINFVTIATTGNATDFGDMVTGTGHGGDGFSDKTRGVIFGQYTDTPHQTAPLNSDSQGAVNLIQMITIQTTGNATDFGDLTANVASLGRKYYANGNSNSHGGLS